VLRKFLIYGINEDVIVKQKTSILEESGSYMGISKIIDSIEGFLSEDEWHCLYNLALGISRNLYIVEIGAHKGRSTSALGEGSKKGNKNRVFTVDLWDLDIDRHSFRFFSKKGTYEEFCYNMETLNLAEVVHSIKGESSSIASSWNKDKEIGLLFIDGGHSLEEVERDFESWYPLVAKKGFIIFHDYCVKYPILVDFVNKNEGSKIEKEFIVDSLYVSKKL